jgi:hypothetical protein
MRYRTLFLFILTFAAAVGAALVPAVNEGLFTVLLFIAFPFFSALMFVSIVYDIAHPRPAHTKPVAQPAQQPQRTAPPTIARPRTV